MFRRLTWIRRFGMGGLFMLVAFGFSSTSIQAQSDSYFPGVTLRSGSVGLFGKVASIDSPSPGLSLMVLDTSEDFQVITIEEDTRVTIPAIGGASVSDIVVGDFLAVLARQTNGRLEAEEVLVKPPSPVRISHLVGVVAEAGVGQFVAVDRSGNQVTVSMGEGVAGPLYGQVIIAVLDQDLRTGSLTSSHIELAEDSLARLQSALDQPLTENNRKNLGLRLANNMSGHLTLLRELSGRLSSEARPASRHEIERVAGYFQGILADHELPELLLNLSGIVTLVDTSQSLITISQQTGVTLDLYATEDTAIAVDGKIEVGKSEFYGGFEDILVGHRVNAVYDPLKMEAESFTILSGEELGSELAAEILRDAPSVAGVVQSVNRKTGTVSMLTVEGEQFELVVDHSTAIEHEGIGVTITEVKLGDLIRSTTDFDTITRILSNLDLEAARPAQQEGFIRGVQAISAREHLLTISTPSLELVTIGVNADTLLTRNGGVIRRQDVEIGSSVVALYGRANLEAISVDVLPSAIKRASGTIVAIDEENFVITVETANGKRLMLIISKKTRINDMKGDTATFSNLTLGTRVPLAFYVPETKEIITMTLASP